MRQWVVNVVISRPVSQNSALGWRGSECKAAAVQQLAVDTAAVKHMKLGCPAACVTALLDHNE
jgi:hypothetical protein